MRIIAITGFSIHNKNFGANEFQLWLKTVKQKQANEILIREPVWNKKNQLLALKLADENHFIPILHNAKFENPFGYYHWSRHFLNQKPKYKGYHGISCHNLEELKIAENHLYDYAFLSPIYPTESHPNTPELGINYLKNCVKKCKISIIALGGIQQKNQIQEIKEAGAKGFASIRYFI